jgi:hypothetical protein
MLTYSHGTKDLKYVVRPFESSISKRSILHLHKTVLHVSMSPQAIAKYKDWTWNVIKLFQNYVHAQLLRAELMLHTLWKAKLESLSCTCGPAFVKGGHKNLHGNAPCHHSPFQIRCQCPCDCVMVCLICECHTIISIEWQARSLGVLWVGRVFKVKWISTLVLQCPRKSARLWQYCVPWVCSWCQPVTLLDVSEVVCAAENSTVGTPFPHGTLAPVPYVLPNNLL